MARNVAKQEEASGNTAVATVDYSAIDELEHSEFSAEDLAVPRLRVLQDLSPQTKKTKAQFVEGAKPGMFFNTATEELWSPEPGILIIVAAFLNSYTEWVPRSQGEEGQNFVGDHTDQPNIHEIWREAFNRRGENDKKVLLPNGNELNRSMDYYVMVASAAAPEGPWQEAVFGLSGSQAKKARRFNSVIASRSIVRNGRPIKPLPCAFAYKVGTKEESNPSGTWYGVDIKPWSYLDGPEPTILGIPGGNEIYQRAKLFRELVQQGKKRAAVDQPDADDTDRPASHGVDPGENYGKDEDIPF